MPAPAAADRPGAADRPNPPDRPGTDDRAASLAGPSAADPRFRAERMRVNPQWIDYNGHLNMAYYNVLFDRMLDVAFEAMDIGAAYVARENCSFFTVEVHVCYLSEVTADDRLDLALQILGADGKRLHVFEEMRRARDGVLSATSEGISIHVDLATRRARPWPEAVAARIAPWRDAHLRLPRPERAGRSIRLPERPQA